MEWSCGEIGSPGRQPPVHPEPLAAHAVELTTSPNQLVYKGLFINPTAFDHHVDQPSHQTLLRHGIHIASQLKPAASNHPIIHSFSTSIARKWTAAGSSSPAVVPCNSGAVVAAVFFLLSFSSCYSPSPIARRTLPPASSAATRHRRTCESDHCTAAPLMRYGKYCGVGYTGCPGEAPCDALDACCMIHDACVQATDNDYLNLWCNQSLLDCVAAATSSSTTAATFEGNRCNMTEVADEITSVVEAAVYAWGIFHKP
ncbi:hypothetical protein SETIT_8G146700v2 [Setaria italica]|uniref:phospholipase A2 n=2 Tax=Setaria TaxID=4554 RepID=A0A368S7V3_SETIT|nr:phospholipase A2 homolog 3-like isoform X1 [Setaria viridis]RCV38488.1 hypothetical protein SETIT_8G146700v2 [Setaria italica]TKW01109.1 hypothetical protein SEVIR_8G156700v2 [Setaria viridis]